MKYQMDLLIFLNMSNSILMKKLQLTINFIKLAEIQMPLQHLIIHHT